MPWNRILFFPLCRMQNWGPEVTRGGSKRQDSRGVIHSKARINLDSILKTRDITLLTKVCIVKAVVFPVVMYGREKGKLLSRVRLLETPWTQPTRLLRPWDFPGKSTGVGCHFLLQGTWELDHKEGWAPKNWFLQTVVLEKTLESPLGNKEIKPDNPKGNQPWIFFGRAVAEAPILCPPDVKS